MFATDGSLEDRGLVKPDRNNFAPRVGVVYKLDEQDGRCAAAGASSTTCSTASAAKISSRSTCRGWSTRRSRRRRARRCSSSAQGFPAGFLNAPNLDPAAGQLQGGPAPRGRPDDAPKTTINQASFGMQRELAGGMVLSADFVYTRGSNLATLVNLNQPLPNAAGNNALGALPYPNFGFIEWRAQNGKSDYKGLDLGVEKRFAQRLRVRRRLHDRQLEGQHVRAADHAGVERVPAERARLRAVVRAERLRRPPPLHRQLRRGPAARHRTSSRATGRSRASTPRARAVRSPSTRAATTSART